MDRSPGMKGRLNFLQDNRWIYRVELEEVERGNDVIKEQKLNLGGGNVFPAKEKGDLISYKKNRRKRGEKQRF